MDLDWNPFSLLQHNLLAGSCIVLLLAWLYIKVCYLPYHVLRRNGICGPKPSFFFGNFRECDKVGLLNYWKELKQKYGSIVGTYLGRTPQIIVTDPELIKLVTIKDHENFINRPNFPSFGEKKGILRARSDEWRSARQALTPSFSPYKMKAMTPLVQNTVKTLVAILEKQAGANESLDVLKIFNLFSTETILATAFGRVVDIQRGQSDQLTQAVAALYSSAEEGTASSVYFAAMILSNFPWLEFVLGYFPRQKKAIEAYHTLHETVLEIIDERRQQKSQPGKYKDLLQLMIETTVEEGNSKKGLTDDDITSQAISFFLAGSETTANTISYTAYLLALNPHSQKKLQAEIDSYFKHNTDTTIYQATQDLEYLDMVLHESLRLYPTAAYIVRECGKDYEYKNMTIPKGCHVNCASFLLHMDPDYWTDPEVFDPMRFTTEEKAKRPQHCYMPFGSGQRNCIGMRLALLEAKIALIEILRRFTFIKTPETQIPLKSVLGITMAPKNGVHLKLLSRN